MKRILLLTGIIVIAVAACSNSGLTDQSTVTANPSAVTTTTVAESTITADEAGTPWWNDRDDSYYYGIFWEGMPDLNLRNSSVTAEMHNTGSYWLAEVNADGYRLDAARHLIEDGAIQEETPETYEWLGDFTEAMRGASADSLIVGEIWTDSKAVSS